jgi:aminopeptidase YwaD
MAFLAYLERLAVADQFARRDALLAILRELDSPFTLYREHCGGYRPENVVVRLHPHASQRLVIGAHYDSVPTSTGANDNAAAVCVVLGLLQVYLLTPPALPLDLVFFDLEEVGRRGSQAYLEQIGSSSIRAMINLDVCGVGDTILVGPRTHATTGPIGHAVQAVVSQAEYRSQIVDHLPPGDDWSFEQAGIPNVAVSIAPAEDVPVFLEAVDAMRLRQRPLRAPAIMETMHNRSRDTLAVVEEGAMQQVFRWTAAVVQLCQQLT